MSQTDSGMEDAEKTFAYGKVPQDSKCEDSVTAGGEKLSCATDIMSNGVHDVGKPSNECEGQTGVEKPWKDDINIETQSTEQTETPNHEDVVANSSNERLIVMSTEDEKEIANKSVLDMEVGTREEASKLAATEPEEKERNVCLDPAVDPKEAEDIVNDIGDKKVEHDSGEIHKCVKAIEDPEKGDSKSKEITKIPVAGDETPCIENGAQNEIMLVKDAKMEMAVDSYSSRQEHDRKGQDAQPVVSNHENKEIIRPVETSANNIKDSSSTDHHEFSTPNAHVRYSPSKAGDHCTETAKNVSSPATVALIGGGDDGTLEEQSAFVKEVESFYKERSMDFKQPKFYGQPLNCLKLWKAVIKLGGYDKVTAMKLWRQVGESFHPPKTCTTVSWTFRIFYEKSLLEFERQKTQNGELQLPVTGFLEAVGGDSEGSGYLPSGAGSGSAPGRARRDSVARAMQGGWHGQQLLTSDEDKNLNNVAKREKTIKSSGTVKQKRPSETDQPNKIARTETPKQLVTPIVDVGPPADWVKINVLQTHDCFEVYALVPGLLREEVRVQSDPAGRVVITGQPEQLDNPWGTTPFKKVVNLPERIDPLQTSAVVSMHGRLFVRVPFEKSSTQPKTPS